MVAVSEGVVGVGDGFKKAGVGLSQLNGRPGGKSSNNVCYLDWPRRTSIRFEPGKKEINIKQLFSSGFLIHVKPISIFLTNM